MNFLKNVLATIVGLFLFFMICFFALLFISAIAGSSDEVKVKENSVIELDLAKVQFDYAGKTNYKEFNYFANPHNGLFDIIKALKYAKKDSNIKGISILNNNTSLGIAQTKALRNALEDFKKSGKFVYSYSNIYTQKSYYLNSVANKLYINPVGQLDFKGFSAEYMFFKDFQEKTGLKMEVIRHGKYKSAVEPFLENKMSDANKTQTSELLHAIWNAVVTDISKSRKIPVETLNDIANNLNGRTPQLALQNHLIDKIAYEDVYHNDIKKLIKVAEDKDYETIKIEEYSKSVATQNTDLSTKDKIAIVYAQGEIMGGEGDVNVIGEGAMHKALKEAREDKNVKAVLLRVDSPGGSALTSELIWREIELTKKVKPVVVSMGNYAASGGYYISCNANTIFAESTTITGSIGVFGMLPNFSEATSRIGIHVDQVKTHNNASSYSPFRPLDDNFKQFTTEGIENVYQTFLTRVAAGRKMTVEQVDAIAQGRVWSGEEAIKIGLVDKIGGLQDALQEAAKLAKIKAYRTVDYPEYEKSFEDVLAAFGLAQSKENLIKQEIGEDNYFILQKIKQLSMQKGVQARMEYQLIIN